MRKLLSISMLAAGLSACVPSAPGDLVLDEQGQPLVAENGLSANGISTNGISTNGISTNGISTNGISTNGISTNGLSASGLSTASFSSWFNQNPAYSDMVMKYMVKCACDAGVTRSFGNYSWAGDLGLAPVWCGGGKIPGMEQQLVSACLAAHVNKYGIHVGISVRGIEEDGKTQIPVDSNEEQTYPVREGCFFGNLFDGSGVFSAYDGGLNHAGTTSARACAMSNGDPADCAPMTATGRACSSICNQLIGPANTGIWKDCTWNGKHFRAITTRLKPQDVYSCGDGVCQFTESCYNPSTATGCQADCGTCPQ